MKKSILTLGLAGLIGMPAAYSQTVLSVSNWTGPGQTTAVKEWCDTLESNSKGQVKCNILPRPVSAPPGSFDAVRNGVVDISLTVHGYTPNRFVLTQIAEFPFLGDDAEATSVAYDRIASKYPQFGAAHEGVRVLGYFTHGPGMVFNSQKKVASIEDFQGLKLRVGGGMVNKIAQAVGINATLKPASEAYELVSSGVMDGTLFPAESIAAYKLEDTIKYATSFPGGLYNTSWVFMMNPATYEKLSAEEKKAVDSVSGEVVARIFGRMWDRLDKAGHEVMQKAGVEETQADEKFVADVKAKTASLEQDWAQAAEAQGLKEPLSVLAEFRKTIAELQ
ncbi:TRAP transporter substrate-binding protein [Pusillimonas noertemannii]|uniref:TRAP-type C4-dicarboxylate transport system substrate-binding protein n=1 Tax=Pusillimonas noertemannii TaxID=305977 RepID=A0A2U1CL11_9BURK|nr:TRAP transporter substrate-binding protein [Pusillimonas noertemannii]NYT69209.1 TRAP transporter substrate-binding protein [Pusillimonas noertemannii]PVY61678.1 TRAP-type C4-dicarboxylate transport system substrate-binding protein [Pusillimonas noertemannii]TFL09619.1 TRAP transporter substrate-binding protein [Pusillimonas noertemannii]